MLHTYATVINVVPLHTVNHNVAGDILSDYDTAGSMLVDLLLSLKN